MKSKIGARGRVTIPKLLRERLGMKPETLLEFCDERGRLIATKADELDPVARVFGCLGKGFSTDAFMASLRHP
jgi:AbrB family looped-hinge helix DNA binding protein